MASPNTLARRAAEPRRTVRQFICLFCRQPNTLVRLVPTEAYACPDCIRKHGGKERAALDVPRAVEEFRKVQAERALQEASR